MSADGARAVMDASEVLETLRLAADNRKAVLIKRRSKKSAKAVWTIAKVNSLKASGGTVKVIEFKKLRLDKIEGVKFAPDRKGGSRCDS